MKDLRDWLILALLLGMGFLTVSHWLEGRRADREQARADSLRTEFLQQEVAAAGWETQLTAATRNLEASLLKEAKRGDSLDAMVGDLILQVEAAGGRILSLTELVVELEGRAQDTVIVYGEECRSDSLTGQVDDGLLRGPFTIYPDRGLFDFRYTVSPALTIVQSQTADNRLLTAVRALDPRVTPRVEAVYFQLPQAEQYCSWGTRLRWALGGVGVGFVGGSLAPGR